MSEKRRISHKILPSSAGTLLQIAAAVCWIPQAACLAWSIGSLADNASLYDILPAVIIFCILGLFRTFLDAYGGRLAFHSARITLSQLRKSAVQALGHSSPLDIERPASGQAASIVAEQAEAVLPYLVRYLPIQRKAMIVTPAILLAVLPFSWVASFILLIAAPLIPIFMALVGLKAKEASEEQMLEIGGMNAFLLDRLRGLATIRAMGAVDITAQKLREAAERLHIRTMAVLRIAFLSSAVLELFSALGVALVAVYVGFHFLGQLPFGAWGGKLTLAEGLFILLLAPAFFEPLRELSVAWHDRAAGIAALNALDQISHRGSLTPVGANVIEGARPELETVTHNPPDISITELSFKYQDKPAVLQGFSLQIAAGEKVAFIGESGSGKSTLLALIAGLVEANAGKITIGNVALADETAAFLRGRMAWISQKPHLFSGTIKSNITLGRQGIGPDEVDAAIEHAALTEFIGKRGTGELIGESGGGLSGGEALRVALARAAANPNMDIVLADEPTAHLDSETAAQVRAGLLKLAKGRTLIVATHDPLLAADMDRVVTLPACGGAA